MLLLRLKLIILLIVLGHTNVCFSKADKSSCSKTIAKILRAENSKRLGPRVFNRFRGDKNARKADEFSIATLNTYERFKGITDEKTNSLAFPFLKQMAKFIEKHDVIHLQEVDTFESLEFFNKTYLGSNYRIFLLQSNDTNNSHMAFLVKNDIPVDIELQSHKYYKKNYKDNIVPIFSRDMPILTFRKPGQSRTDRPFLAFAGIHYKSMGHSKQDDYSMEKRGLQVEATVDILKTELFDKFGKMPVVMFGDFNSDISSREFKLLRDLGFEDTLDLVDRQLEARVTHNYFGNDGSIERKQMDAILTTKSSVFDIMDASIHFYKRPDGKIVGMPKDWDERSSLPSDHNPVWAKIRLKY